METKNPQAPQTQKPTTASRVVTGLVLAAGAAQANAAMDVSGVTSVFTDGGTAAAVIGVAGLIFTVGVVLWKRLRGAA